MPEPTTMGMFAKGASGVAGKAGATTAMSSVSSVWKYVWKSALKTSIPKASKPDRQPHQKEVFKMVNTLLQWREKWDKLERIGVLFAPPSSGKTTFFKGVQEAVWLSRLGEEVHSKIDLIWNEMVELQAEERRLRETGDHLGAKLVPEKMYNKATEARELGYQIETAAELSHLIFLAKAYKKVRYDSVVIIEPAASETPFLDLSGYIEEALQSSQSLDTLNQGKLKVLFIMDNFNKRQIANPDPFAWHKNSYAGVVVADVREDYERLLSTNGWQKVTPFGLFGPLRRQAFSYDGIDLLRMNLSSAAPGPDTPMLKNLLDEVTMGYKNQPYVSLGMVREKMKEISARTNGATQGFFDRLFSGMAGVEPKTQLLMFGQPSMTGYTPGAEMAIYSFADSAGIDNLCTFWKCRPRTMSWKPVSEIPYFLEPRADSQPTLVLVESDPCDFGGRRQKFG